MKPRQFNPVILLGIILCCSLSIRAQHLPPLEISKKQLHGGKLKEEVYNTIKVRDGFLVIGGIFTKPGRKKTLILKVDPDGKTRGEITLDGKLKDGLYSGHITGDNNFLLVGTSWSKGKGEGDVWVLKINPRGQIIWQKTYGGKGWEHGQDVIKTRDGGFLISGFSTTRAKGLRDLFLLKIDENGEKKWERTYGGVHFDFAQCAVEDRVGGFYVLGNTESKGNGRFDTWLLKTDSEGLLEWEKTFGADKWDIGKKLLQTDKGDLYIVGRTQREGNPDIWVIQTNPQGEIQWEQQFGGAEKDIMNDALVTGENGLLLAATTYDQEKKPKSWIIQLDKNGQILRQKFIKTGNNLQIRNLKETSNGDFLLIGNIHLAESHIEQIFLYKITEDPVVKLENYVRTALSKWERKGDFEKLENYKKRVNPTRRREKIYQLVQRIIKDYAKEPFSHSIRNAQHEYDVENEVFRIQFPNMNSIYLPVPLHEAQAFNRNFKDLFFESPEFSIKEKKFMVTYVRIINPHNQKTYTYDSKLPVQYRSKKIDNSYNVSLELENSFNLLNSSLPKESWDTSPTLVGVDHNIPITTELQPQKFALIIGNEDYKSYQEELDAESNVPFAKNDALIIKEYFIKTLGVPNENITMLINATSGQMQRAVRKLQQIQQANGDATEVLVYYAGHGLPDEKTRDAYLIPVDINGNSLEFALRVNELCKALTETPTKRVTLILDACFSGGARAGTLISRRGVRVKPKAYLPASNLIIFSSSSDEESAGAYVPKRHGLFTYFLLKKLQETEGNISYSELAENLNKEVRLKSILINNKQQTPTVTTNPSIGEEWKKWTFK
ncbi:caspase family protein [Xanthovirga aplysinae]|uniref:caspase family protein n=1 Tax=Xanthovirga aplysinae TaxID=2529853 RepID=UPI0012BCAB3D|nr:caspase family protein [Xanthovirga aplysinae]MTI32962.1 caspase family protein [Xanthovirga aplysinae]